MKLQPEVVFSPVFPKQPSDGDVTIRGWVGNRRAGGKIADGRVRKKGMDTKEGMEGENIRMARGQGMEFL